MQELNKCPQCGRLLVAYEEIVSLHGKLLCSRYCAVQSLAEEITEQNPAMSAQEAYTEAMQRHIDEAEVVRAEDVLGEDLQDVQIAVTYYKTVKMPKNMSEEEMKQAVEGLWQEGIICAEPDDCDDARFECALVNTTNSEHDEEV